MQFRPVGIERPGEEQVPEAPDFGEQARFAVLMVHDAGRRCESRHDGPAFLSGDFCRAQRFFFALAGSFWRESLKEGFNCCYP
jgi:hypothetical protein